MSILSVQGLRRLASILIILALPLLLGAWQDFTGNTINPRFVQRIQNGKTTKGEILAFFGEPKEVQKTDLGPVYKYFSYRDAPLEKPYRHEQRHIEEQSDQQYLIDDNKQIRKPEIKTEGKILRSTLNVHFKSDGETVMSYEYKEIK